MTQQLELRSHGRESLGLLPIPRGTYRISSLPVPEYMEQSVDRTRSITLSVVLPTYQERTNLLGMVTALSHLLDEVLPGAYELIVVDDDSPDQTWKVALQLANHYPALRVMRRTQERGLATAVVRGWQVARGDILAVIDTDLQQPPEVLLELLQHIQDGADLAIASRYAQGGRIRNRSLLGNILNWGARGLGRLLLPGIVGQVSDPMSGYFLVRRSAIADATLHPAGYKILLEVLSRGVIHTIVEVGYIFQSRREKIKHIVGVKILGYLRHLLHLRISCCPLRGCQTSPTASSLQKKYLY